MTEMGRIVSPPPEIPAPAGELTIWSPPSGLTMVYPRSNLEKAGLRGCFIIAQSL